MIVAGVEVLRNPGRLDTGVSEYLNPGHNIMDNPQKNFLARVESSIQDETFIS
jgi:hypothetical protein